MFLWLIETSPAMVHSQGRTAMLNSVLNTEGLVCAVNCLVAFSLPGSHSIAPQAFF